MKYSKKMDAGMSNYHLVLNSLLDERDCLVEQLDEAVAECDYQAAHWFEEALYRKNRSLYHLSGQWPGRGDRFYAPPVSSNGAISQCLKQLLRPSTDLRMLEMSFQNQYQRRSGETADDRLRVARTDGAIHLTLSKIGGNDAYDTYEGPSDYHLRHIGWQPIDLRNFTLIPPNKQLDTLKTIIARTIVEVLWDKDTTTTLRTDHQSI